MINPFRRAAEVEPVCEGIPIMTSGRWQCEGVSMTWDDGSGYVELTIAKHGTQTVRLSVEDARKILAAMATGIDRACPRYLPLPGDKQGST